MAPPKKPAPKESKKTQEKKREKVVEDKTFGLKNKKGAKTQKFIQQVHKQVKGNQIAMNGPPKPSKKEEKKKEQAELNAIFRPVVTANKNIQILEEEVEEEKPKLSMEEAIEVERAKIPQNLPKITLSMFVKWKQDKLKERKAKLAKEEAIRREDFKAGRHLGLSGREMFTFNQDLAADNILDEDEVALDNYDCDDDEEALDAEGNKIPKVTIKDIDLEELMLHTKDLALE